VRRESPALGDGELVWLDSGHEDVLAMERPGTPGIVVLLNVGDGDRRVTFDGDVLVASGDVRHDADGALVLPADSSTWLSRP
ncbi:DUF3459 domain-containing protein, partial [Acinetobacter baumannii]